MLHCPYCHGYEVREKKTGIIANGDTGFEMAKTISQWTDFRQHSDLACRLGCQHTEAGYIETDIFGKISVAGVFAAGDNMTLFRSLAGFYIQN